MAKRYDPIMCMMVDEPTKAQDAKSYGKYKLPNGEIVEVIDRKNVHGVDTIVYKNSRGVHFATVDWFMSNAKKVYDSAKAKDGTYGTVSDYYNQMKGKSKSEVERILASAEGNQNAYLAYKEWKKRYDKAKDSNALDKAITTADGMFASTFGKYSSAAKQHYDRAVKELDSFKGEIKDYLTLAGKWEMQIRNDLTRIDEAYNVAGNDYYAARREIQETMDSLTQVMLRKAREKRK